jgi:hypothetical protein
MAQFAIRYNKTAGKMGRGTPDHVWRVFDGPKEYIVKQVRINVPSWGEKTGEDWSICCDGQMEIDRQTSTVTINARST